MDDALWTDVHVRTRGHLPILRDAECVHAGEVVLGRMVRDDHPLVTTTRGLAGWEGKRPRGCPEYIGRHCSSVMVAR